jgi:hypothetical protein
VPIARLNPTRIISEDNIASIERYQQEQKFGKFHFIVSLFFDQSGSFHSVFLLEAFGHVGDIDLLLSIFIGVK